MKEEFDLIVLGTGAAGSTSANSCREAGWRVAIIDDQPFGGTCGNRGCDPKKVLVGAADVVSWHRRMRGHGVAGDAAIDWPALMAFKRSFTDPLLPSFEGALVDRLIAHTKEIGVDVRLEHSVCAVERASPTAPFQVHVGHGANMQIVEADLVVHGAGRVPNSARIGAAEGRVELEHHGAIRVNEFLQSVSNPRVYAAGDVVSPPGAIPLTPVAGHEGTVVAANLLSGNSARPDLRAIPSAVLTLPVLAGVGLTEKAARAKGIEVRIATGDTTQWFANRRIREPVGMFKTIIDETTNLVVGAHLLGAQSEEVINLFAMAIRFDIPVPELKKMIVSYPTGSSRGEACRASRSSRAAEAPATRARCCSRARLGSGLDEELIDVAPAPVLTGLKALHDRVLRLMEMLGRMLSLRLIAAADVAALLTQPKMHPLHPELETLLAALRSVRRDVAHLIEMAAAFRGLRHRRSSIWFAKVIRVRSLAPVPDQGARSASTSSCETSPKYWRTSMSASALASASRS